MDSYITARVYPVGYSDPTEELDKYLRDGYKVIRVDSTINERGITCNDYLLYKNKS